MILRARLSIEMRFGPQARVTTVGAFLRHGLTVVFALLGLGPLSFVLIRQGETTLRRLVRLGDAGDAERVSVRSGLTAGEQVVLPAG